MEIAKRIKGIRSFLTGRAKNTGWHITTETAYLAYLDWTGIAIIEMMSENGYIFLGATGNGLCFRTK